MAFNINAQVILTGPKNIKAVTNQIQQQLQGVNANVNVRVPKKANQQLNQLNQGMTRTGASTKKLNQQSLQSVQSLNRMGGAARNAGGAMHMLGKETALTFKRFAAAGIVTATFFRLTSAISEAVPKALEFQREMVRLQQVTGKTAAQVGKVGEAARQLSLRLGIDANELAGVARIFAQAGQSIKQVQASLDAVAKSSLAPTFGEMEQTAEGLIAALNQFNIQASESEAVLGAINRVSKKFAVESADIIAAIRRAGGVFAISAGQFTEPIEALEQFISVFTAVRSTTRESAETIATGLRTIFTRMQRKDTIEALRDLGIELVDTEGKFVGMFDAFRRISVELEKVIQQGDALTLSGITEELGGIRQMGKLVPALKEFAKAQAAMKEAQKGAAEGLGPDVAKGLTPLIKQFELLQSRFSDFIRSIAESSTFNTMAKAAIGLANAFMKIGEVLTPLLPMISAIMISKGTQMFGGFMSGFMGGFGKGPGIGASIGQAAGGAGSASSQAQTTIMSNISTKLQTLISGDTTRQTQLQTISTEITTLQSTLVTSLNNLNLSIKNMPRGRRMATGGLVPGSGSGDTVPAMLTPGEFVIRKSAVGAFGAENLGDINKYKAGGMIIKRTDDTKFDGIFARPRGADQSGKAVSSELNKIENGFQVIGITGAPKSILTSGADEQGFEKYAEKKLRQAISGMSKKMAGKKLKKGPIADSIVAEIGAKDIAGKIFEGMVKVVTRSFSKSGTEGSQKTWDIPRNTIANNKSEHAPAIARLFGPISNTKDHDAKLSEHRKARISLLKKAMASGYVKDVELTKFSGTYGDKTNDWLTSMPRGQDKNAAIMERIAGIESAKGKVDNLMDTETGTLLKSRLQKMIAKLRKALPPSAGKKRKRNALGGQTHGTDTVPALLTPGEFVVNKASAQAYGYGNLRSINKYAKGGRVQRFKDGDVVGAGAKMQTEAIGSGNLQLAIGNLAGGMTGLVSTIGMMKEQGVSFATALNLATSAAMLFTAIQSIPFGSIAKSFKGLSGKFGAAGKMMAPGTREKMVSTTTGMWGQNLGRGRMIPDPRRTLPTGMKGLRTGAMGGLYNSLGMVGKKFKVLGNVIGGALTKIPLVGSALASAGTALAGTGAAAGGAAAGLSAMAAPIAAFVATALVLVGVFYLIKKAGDGLIDMWFQLEKKSKSWASTEENKIEGRKGTSAKEAGQVGAAKGVMTGIAVAATLAIAGMTGIGLAAGLVVGAFKAIVGHNVEEARQGEFLAYDRLGKAADAAAISLKKLADDEHITSQELLTSAAVQSNYTRSVANAAKATTEKKNAETLWGAGSLDIGFGKMDSDKNMADAERREGYSGFFSGLAFAFKKVVVDPIGAIALGGVNKIARGVLPGGKEWSDKSLYVEEREAQQMFAQARVGAGDYMTAYKAAQERTGAKDLGAGEYGKMVDKAFSQAVNRVDTAFLKTGASMEEMTKAMNEAGLSTESFTKALSSERDAKIANAAAAAAESGTKEGQSMAFALKVLSQEAAKAGKSVSDLSDIEMRQMLVAGGYAKSTSALSTTLKSGILDISKLNLELKREQTERQKTTFIMDRLTRAANIANGAVDVFVSGMGRLAAGIKEASGQLAMELSIMKNMFKDAGKSVQSFRPQLNVFKNLETSSNEQIALATGGVMQAAGLGGEAGRVSATVQLSKALPDIFRKASKDLALTPELETPQQIYDALGNVAADSGFDNWDQLPDAISEQIKASIATIQTRQGGKINIEELFKTMLSTEEYGKLNEAMSKASSAVTKSMAEIQDALFNAQKAYVTVLQQEVAIIQAGIKARTSEQNIIKKVEDALAQFEPNKGKFTRKQMARQQAQRQQAIFGPGSRAAGFAGGATTNIAAQQARVEGLVAQNERMRNDLAAAGGAVMGNVSDDSIAAGQKARADAGFGPMSTTWEEDALNNNTKALENEMAALKALIASTDKLTGIQNELAARARDRMTAREITQRDTKLLAEASMIKNPAERDKFLEENFRGQRAFQKFAQGKELDEREFIALDQGVEEAIKLARAGGVDDGKGGIRRFTDEDEAKLRQRYAEFQERAFPELNKMAGRDLAAGQVMVGGNLAQRQRAAKLAATTTTAPEEKLKRQAREEARQKAEAQKMLDDLGISGMKDGLDIANKALGVFQTQVVAAGKKLQEAITDMDTMSTEAREIREAAQADLASSASQEAPDNLASMAASRRQAAIDAVNKDIAEGNITEEQGKMDPEVLKALVIHQEDIMREAVLKARQAIKDGELDMTNEQLNMVFGGERGENVGSGSATQNWNQLVNTNAEFSKFAEKALNPGSIYTHDIHLEKILSKIERHLAGKAGLSLQDAASPSSNKLAQMMKIGATQMDNSYTNHPAKAFGSNINPEFKSMVETLNKVADGLSISVSMAPMEIVLNTAGFTDQMQNIVTKLALDSMAEQLPAMIEARKSDVIRALGMENA